MEIDQENAVLNCFLNVFDTIVHGLSECVTFFNYKRAC